ncbi:MAG: bifunctional 2-polyprenyl-6-hydroxyphenol methylase/3-demethylubiquinol 3-O-methyltransferase UbiG [Pseudomonadota bacterium]
MATAADTPYRASPEHPSAARPETVRNVDRDQVDRFAAMAAEWWDTSGKFRPLHQIGPARLAFVREALIAHFGLSAHSLRPLTGLAVLDIGCGGGLIAEPLARLGANVTGLDPAPESIAVAEAHAAAQGLGVAYRAGMVEDVADAWAGRYDAVLALEVVEHVPDVGAFIAMAAGLLRPGGLLILSTINRTAKSYALAIIAAEYILRWLPPGTHDWDRFVTPDELATHLAAAGLSAPRFEGLAYDPFADRWSLGAATDVNYMAAAAKPD